MGMSTHVIGFIPPDDRWREMKGAWDACEKAGIPIPKSVQSFFNDEPPDSAGVEVEIAVREWSNDYANGYELDLGDVPAAVKTIRFYNSW